MMLQFQKIDLFGAGSAEWASHEHPNGQVDLIVHTFDARLDNYDMRLFEAAKHIWGKVDVDYTDEVKSHSVLFTDITPGFEGSFIKILSDNMNAMNK
jgi:hypothetical protein